MLRKEQYVDNFVELIRRASTELPPDVVAALRDSRDGEDNGSLAQQALDTILENVELARQKVAPICQDTGTPVAWVRYPTGTSTRLLQEAMEEAVRTATARSYLRPNAVNTLTGKNTGDGAGRAIPFLHFEEWDEEEVEVRLILKGGGCENVGVQYKLPDSRLQAGRDLEGVRKVVLDAVVQAQGKGCAPGVLGVCVGGDRVSGFAESKAQLLRSLSDRNGDEELAALEETLLKEANQLGIGPMGFGGQTTVLGVKVGVLDRLPASYFVTVSYMCWADRRASVRLSKGGEAKWLN
jgi:fumarate hydratase class I